MELEWTGLEGIEGLMEPMALADNLVDNLALAGNLADIPVDFLY